MSTGAVTPRAQRKPRRPATITGYDMQDTRTRKLADYLADSGYRVEIYIRRDYPGSTIFSWWRTHNGSPGESYHHWPKHTAERVLGEWIAKARGS